MSTRSTILGTCPECGRDIPPIALLIEYRRSDGPAAFAACPGCGDVVHPESV